ncbi:MAG: hypothetical protein A2Z34_00990 [Planctomycetes bacterium RBG_16_59_8]|nr:MAG: hypothetical protein A2Z34_00990 [Planctomycetes bacterium RBG_16_59_8]
MFRTIWNLVLVCCGIALLWLFVPKVLSQFKSISLDLPDALRARIVMSVFQGVGLIVVVLLLLGSISSWAWQRVSAAGRWFYGIMGVSLLGGAGVSIYIDHAEMGFVGYGDYATFGFSVLLIAFPVVAFGTGHIGLACRFWKRRCDSADAKRNSSGDN